MIFMSDFTTENPKKTWQVKVIEGFVADNGIVVHPETIFTGEVINVKELFEKIDYYFACSAVAAEHERM